MIKRIMIVATAIVAVALPATAAQASGGSCPDNSCNATQPSPLFFGEVKSGTHPVKQVVLTNHTGRNQYIRKFILAGAGGGKFSLAWFGETCRVGMNLRQGESCTIRVRVVTSFPAWWETNLQINAGPRIQSRPKRVVWNGVVFAHVVP